MVNEELPLGFTFALANDPPAMKKFCNSPREKRDEILQRARAVSSKQEMQALVHSLAEPE